MFKKIIFYILFKLLTVEICSNSFLMHKENTQNNEFNQYIFNLSLDNQEYIYPSYFNMKTFYIHILDNKTEIPIFSKDDVFNISIRNQTFHYLNTSKSEKYYASVGISRNFTNFKEFQNIEKENQNKSDFCFLNMIEKEQENNKSYKGSYISLIQKENDEAIMSFGEFDSQFDTGISRQCQSEYGYYFSCQVSSIKIGVSEIYTSSTSKLEIGIFSISDEYIILPNKAGNETIIYYIKKIKELSGVECKDESGENDEMVNITCDYFNYEDLPDLYFEMKGGMGVMALSVDMFKILSNYKVELKIKYRKKTEEISTNFYKWILGEPVTKNYNFFVNYTDKEKPYLIIVPSSLNGFILILVATVGGFLFLFIFLIIIYCSAKKENKLKNSFEEKGRYRNNFFSMDKNYINESIEEDGNEIEEKDEEDEDNIDKDDNDNIDNNLIDNDNIDNDADKEENKLLNHQMNDELKNLKINDIKNDKLDNNKIINNNKNNKNEKDINTNTNNIQKNINNEGMELISNNVEDATDENDTFL